MASTQGSDGTQGRNCEAVGLTVTNGHVPPEWHFASVTSLHDMGCGERRSGLSLSEGRVGSPEE